MKERESERERDREGERGRERGKERDREAHACKKGRDSLRGKFSGIIRGLSSENYEWELSSENYELVYNITWKIIGILAYPKMLTIR